MWYLVVFIVALLLVAALTPKPNIENARAAKLGDFQFPRSKHGDPMPLVWGTVRQKSPITAWYGDFRPVAITEKVKTGQPPSRGCELKLRIGHGRLQVVCPQPPSRGCELKRIVRRLRL